jgi:hypothetical protein
LDKETALTLEAILNRLKSTLKRARGVEATVHWLKDGGWTDATGETLENEEIVFYAEGLLMDEFGMAWQLVGAPGMPDHLRLFFWQEGPSPLPDAPEGMQVLETAATTD